VSECIDHLLGEGKEEGTASPPFFIGQGFVFVGVKNSRGTTMGGGEMVACANALHHKASSKVGGKNCLKVSQKPLPMVALSGAD
jgi:hypothetical protein